MKKSIGFLCLALFLLLPISAGATPIDVTMQVYYSAPTGSVAFPSGVGNYYLDYDVSIDHLASTEAFCVENANAPASGAETPYTLLTIGSDVTAQKYLAAAWVANYFLTNGGSVASNNSNDSKKAAAQIAIWEIIFDWNPVHTIYLYGLNLDTGGFYSASSNPYKGDANIILDSLKSFLQTSKLPTSGGGWALAVNPTTGGTANFSEVTNYQNYLVHVPEPTMAIMLGGLLLGIGVLGRRQFLKR